MQLGRDFYECEDEDEDENEDEDEYVYEYEEDGAEWRISSREPDTGRIQLSNTVRVNDLAVLRTPYGVGHLLETSVYSLIS